ncbi:MAG: hypothetical protein AAGG51_16760 [Cyanobacteria bacterium P01_G01_bin.54]
MAKLLAQDLEKFAPGHLFIICTDIPALFKDSSNVLVIRHSCRGVLPLHERRFAIFHALETAFSVMYIDSDVRICAPVPETLNFQPGLTARSCGNLQKHMKIQFEKASKSPIPSKLHREKLSKLHRKKYVVNKMSQRAGIDITHPDLKFINEFLFVVTKDEGRELEFLNNWGDLAIYADTLGLHGNPTYAMALAANKSNFSIHRSKMIGLDFFDDRVERIRISKGQSSQDSKAEYFRQQESIEQEKEGSLNMVKRSTLRNSRLLYNRIRVRLMFKLCPSKLIDYAAF